MLYQPTSPIALETRFDIFVAYADRDRLTVFRDVDGNIHIKDASEKALNMDDAEVKAMQLATAQLGTPQSRQWYGWRTVQLRGKLDDALFGPTDRANMSPPPKFIDISRRNGNWEIILEGQWKEKITLNDNYEVTKLERVR